MSIPTTSSERALRPLLLAGLGLFALYLLTAYPTVSPYRDSGDMAASALTLGVAHPPGYPFYLLLAHAWLCVFPLGNIAFRLHVLSILAGVAACLVLADALKRYSKWVPLLVLALSPCFWRLSLVSEMYSLNALVAAVLLHLLLREEKDLRSLCAAGLVFGLGLGNHQTLAAAAPGLLWMCRPWSRRRLLLPAAFVLLGFALYAYLPVRSSTHPVLDWGEPHTLRGFLRALTRADYGGVRLHPERAVAVVDIRQLAASAVYAARLFGRELGWAGMLLALFGAWRSRRDRTAQGCVLAFLLSGPLFVVWANLDPALPESAPIIEPHLVLPVVFAAALAGMGAFGLLDRVRSPGLGACLLLLLCAASQARPAAARLATRGDFSAWDYGKALLASLPRGALLLDPDDPTAFTVGYMAAAHGLRTDVVPVLYFRTRWGYEQLRRRHPELLPAWELNSGQELLASLVSRSLESGRPVYLDLPQKAPFGHASFPMGAAYRMLRAPPSPAEARALLELSVRLSPLIWLRPPAPAADFFTRHAAAYWPSALNNLGIQAQSAGMPGLAVELYRRGLSFMPDLAEAWNNLGNTLLGLNDLVGAEGCYRQSVRLKPSPQVVYNLGRVYLLAGRFDEAEAQLRRSIREGGPPDARNDLGLVFLRRGQAQEAAANWLALARDLPGYALAYFNLGIAYERLGDKQRAILAVQTYEELVADPAEKRAARDWLGRLEKL
jgi:tetratricopeptide (TPR) repeat protein